MRAAKQGQLNPMFGNSHTTESRAIMAAVNAKQVLCYELTSEGPPKGRAYLNPPERLIYSVANTLKAGQFFAVTHGSNQCISKRIKQGSIFVFDGAWLLCYQPYQGGQPPPGQLA